MKPAQTDPDYAPRAQPPTPAEVRAVARLWGEHSVWCGYAPCVFTENVKPHGVGPVPSLLWLGVENGRVVVENDGDGKRLSDVLVSGADAEFMWFALSPDGGPVAWSALAAMVAEGGDRG